MEENFDRTFFSKIISLDQVMNTLGNENLTKTNKQIIDEKLIELMSSILSFVKPSEQNLKPEDPKICCNRAINESSKLVNTNQKILDSYISEIRTLTKPTFENVKKCQYLFIDEIDNSDSIFIPKIKEKYNKKLNLDSNLIKFQQAGYIPYDYKISHPYEYELSTLEHNETIFDALNEIKLPNTYVNTGFCYVDDEESLKNIIEELSKETIISFDVHNHSFRSYLGFICFVEISSPTTDYLIDCLKLRSNMYLLNKIFTHPDIVKIGLDVQEKLLWLQRDFGVYTLNLFDLKTLLLKLKLPISFPFLTQTILGFPFQKIYIDFDFRKRPLSYHEKLYLRIFSSFALRIFPNLRDNLPIEDREEIYKKTFESSKEICKVIYDKKEITSNDGYQKLYKELKDNLDNIKLQKLKKLITWRDTTARIEDESRDYILPDELIIKIISCDNIPKDIDSLKLIYKTYPFEVSLDHYHNIVNILQDKDCLYEEKVNKVKYENNGVGNGNTTDKDTELLHSLFTPNRSFQKPMNCNNSLEKSSPAYDQEDLHRLINWSSGKKPEFNIGDLNATPNKQFQDILTRTILTPSILKDSPSDEVTEDQCQLLNILNNKHDANAMRKEAQKLIFKMPKSETKLNEIKEVEDNLVDILDLVTAKENLPQNINEIYELGNKIRKKNKNKKKKEFKGVRLTHQESSINNANSLTSIDNLKATPSKNEYYCKSMNFDCKSNSGNKFDLEDCPEAFLRELGWLDQKIFQMNLYE